MGFITEEVAKNRDALLQSEREKEEESQRFIEQLEEEAERLRQAELEREITQFCSQDSLRAIASAVRDAVVREYLARGYVSSVRILWEMPDSLYHNERCTRALLVYLQVLEPKTKEVELSRRAGADMHCKSVVEVYFSGPLTVT